MHARWHRARLTLFASALLLLSASMPTAEAADPRAWSTPVTIMPPPTGPPKIMERQPVIERSSRIESILLQADSPDIAITLASDTEQSENSIFIDPINPCRLLNSNNSANYPYTHSYGADYWVSKDGGQTWSGSVVFPQGDNGGDPATGINRNGRMFVNYIGGGGQAIAYSDNDGASWTQRTVALAPVCFDGFLDKNHMWVDTRPSPLLYSGYVYVAWTLFDPSTDCGGPNDGEIGLKRSTNGGVNWPGSPQYVSTAVNALINQGVNLQTGPNGEVYAAWSIYDSFPADENAIGFAKSTNGGATWLPATRILTNIRGHRLTGLGGGKGMRVNSFPSMSVNQQTGEIYLVWTNVGVPGVNTGDPDIYLVSSTNGGTTWSSPRRVNQDQQGNGNDQCEPPRDCRRLQFLRGLGHGKAYPVLPRGSRTSSTTGV